MWPEQSNLSPTTVPEEEKSACHLTTTAKIQPIIALDCFRSSPLLSRSLRECSSSLKTRSSSSSSERSPHLTVTEFAVAESYWVSVAQGEGLPEELKLLQADLPLPKNNCLLTLRPFLDELSVLGVGG